MHFISFVQKVFRKEGTTLKRSSTHTRETTSHFDECLRKEEKDLNNETFKRIDIATD